MPMQDAEIQFSYMQPLIASAQAEKAVRMWVDPPAKKDASQTMDIKPKNYVMPIEIVGSDHDPAATGSMTVQVLTADNSEMTGAETVATHTLTAAQCKRPYIWEGAIPSETKQYVTLSYVLTGTFGPDFKITAGMVDAAGDPYR